MAAYADHDDLISRYDERTVRDLLSDDGTPVGDLSGDSKLSANLQAASGRVEAACLVGQIYTAANLAALTGNTLELLKEIVCDLCMLRLVMRRPEKVSDEHIKVLRETTEEYLEQLRKGERLFDVTANVEAGLPTVDGPTAIDYQNLNLLPDRIKNYYPARARRLPIGRG